MTAVEVVSAGLIGAGVVTTGGLLSVVAYGERRGSGARVQWSQSASHAIAEVVE
jgi:hypothetical protein